MTISFENFKSTLDYLPEEDIQLIHRAFLVAKKAHIGQIRKSGQDYITHPLAVAEIISSLKLDPRCVSAALLHDVVEDTKVTYQDIHRKFGQDIADLVEGVTKIKRIPAVSKKENQAENFRKLLMAMCKDIRVLIIKLADRLHNMQTIEYMPRTHQIRIALETLDIYAPLARRLGVNTLASQLETLGFEVKHPLRAQTLKAAIIKAQGHNHAMLAKITSVLKAQLEFKALQVLSINSREKHVYSIYKKMQDKGVGFTEITDMFALRICVSDINSCYQVLGIVHSQYKPVPNTFKDYIALPKANGYQSLHTILFGPNATKIEVQIRTKDMDDVANSGVAAHCLYKLKEVGVSKYHLQSQEWLSKLMTMQSHVGSTLEFMEHVKVDLCPDEIYVFTPQGDIVELPSGSSVLDFAYAIHTQMGNLCVSAKIDQQMSPLSTLLENGQTIAVTTNNNAKPSQSWLNSVKTAKARSAIRHALRSQRKDDLLELGKKLLKKYCQSCGLVNASISDAVLKEVAISMSYADEEDLFEAIATGLVAVREVGHLLETYLKKHKGVQIAKAIGVNKPLIVNDKEHAAMTYAECCYPIPGDEIAGLVVEGKGVVVHRQHCNTYLAQQQGCDNVALEWGENLQQSFQVGVELHINNQRGALATTSVIVANEHADVQDLNIKIIDEHEALIRLVLLVKQSVQLHRIIRMLDRQPCVYRVARFAMNDLNPVPS